MITLGLYLVATTCTAFSQNFLELRAGPLLHRRRHRRRVLGDQLGDRRADPGARPRLGRPGDQRLVLARDGDRRGRIDRPAESQVLRDRPRLARRLRHRRDARARRAPAAPVPAREPALADDPRPGRGGRADRRRDRGARSRSRPTSELARARGQPIEVRADARPSASARSSGAMFGELPAPVGAGLLADGQPGVPVQRDLLHLRPRADQLLRRRRATRSGCTCCRSPPATSSARCCWAACSTRSAGGSMISSTYIISGVGLVVVGCLFQQNAVSADRADDRLVGDLLLRLGRRQRRLPDRQRDLPDGVAGDGDRVLLRHRDRHRRDHRSGALRPQHRDRQPHHACSTATCWAPAS